jgi:hypothetical protein
MLQKLSGLMVLAVLVLATSAVEAGNLNPTIRPPNSNPYGKSYGEWGGLWWQWALSIPADINPVADTTGEFAAVGQSGPVWFLAGTFGGEANRTVTVPAGKGLFFPIYNQVWVNLPELGDNPWSPEQEAFARDLVASLVDSATALSAAIDGRAVENITAYRSPTPEGGAYMVDFPEGDVWGLTTVYGLPPGSYGPSVSDGYYLMLTPLSAGKHTIQIAAADSTGFSLDVTYNLTVVGGKAAAVPEPSALVLAAFALVGLAGYGWRRAVRKRS